MEQLETDPPAEPLWTVATVTTLAAAAVGLLVAFGLPISDGQQNALLVAVGAAAPLLVAAIGRRHVYSPATVARDFYRRSHLRGPAQ